MFRSVYLVLAAIVLVACAAMPAPPPTPQVRFVDLAGFDAQLGSSLERLPRVEVEFYDRVVPSQLPERLQRWLGSLQEGGGKVSVTAPPSTVSAKSPMLVIGALTTLWSARKMANEAGADAALRSARQHDAQIVLRQDDRGDVVLDRIVFTRKGS